MQSLLTTVLGFLRAYFPQVCEKLCQVVSLGFASNYIREFEENMCKFSLIEYWLFNKIENALERKYLWKKEVQSN